MSARPPRLLALLLLSCATPEPPGPRDGAPLRREGLPGERPTLRDALWDDGRAEIASYVTREDRYGILRDGDAILIVVKEPFDAERLIKVENGQTTEHPLPVLKLNTVVTVQTGVYTYRQMASAFLAREDARPVKLAIGSQEWCGITAKILTVRGSDALVRAWSYFGDEGDREFRVSIDGATTLADALPLFVRTVDLDRPGERRIRLLSEQLTNRATAPKLEDAVLTVGASSRVEVPAGTFDAIPVEVRREERKDVYWLAREAPHGLVRWDRSDGGIYRLRWVRRAPYWDMNSPQHLHAFDSPPR